MKAPHVCILQTSFAKREDTIAFLKEHVPGVRVEFITDSTLLNDVRAAGGPTQAVIDRMTLYAKAAEISRSGKYLPNFSSPQVLVSALHTTKLGLVLAISMISWPNAMRVASVLAITQRLLL